MITDSYDSFIDFFQDFDEGFTRDLGELKTNEIAKIISTSKTIRGVSEFLIKSERLDHGQVIMEAVMSTRHFMFSKKEVVLYASMVALAKILNDAALQEIRFSDEGMLHVARQILVAAGKI